MIKGRPVVVLMFTGSLFYEFVISFMANIKSRPEYCQRCQERTQSTLFL